MNVLFVAGGNSDVEDIEQFILVQGQSVERQGIHVQYFPIKGKGVVGYLRNIGKLRQFVKSNRIDLIHAHFSYSGVIASLAFTGIPIVMSWLGTDVYNARLINKIILRIHKLFHWKAMIVKSENMAQTLKGIRSYIVPNGVDLKNFRPHDSSECKEKLGWDISKKSVLFAANPDRIEKNYGLAEKALRSVHPGNFDVRFLRQVNHKDVPLWMNAADVVLLTSLWEGSPNVVKEAMACNRPIVATDVGDIRWLFGNLPGHFIAESNEVDLIKKIEQAFVYTEYIKNTSGRQRIVEMGLDSENIASRIVNIYQSVLSN